MWGRYVRRVAAGAAFAVVAVALGSVMPAEAFKPYTHVFTADNAYNDAVDDGMVTIGNGEYPLDPRLLLALQTHRDAYNAGVVGPDAFPDLVMGQSVIHPTDTGKWLDLVLNKAWDAQGDAKYSEDQKLSILAFAYGFLTHAAGDMWAHTLVNDFAHGVFPDVTDALSDPQAAAIALRHLIVEGYIGDATPGYDGLDDRTLVAGEVNEDGDPQVSDDATHAISYEQPPDDFLWDVFVGRAPGPDGLLTQPLPGQPTADRGKILNFFFDLRNDLAVDAGSNSNIQAALTNLENIADHWNDLLSACEDFFSLECAEAIFSLPFETAAELAAAAQNAIEGAVEAVIDAYLAAWVEDIDHGLRHWGNIGDAFAEGLFNPAARRQVQDEECGETGSGEGDIARALCEDGVGLVGTFLESIGEGFTTSNPHLLSMLGFPDFVAGGIELIDELFDALDALVDFPFPFESEIAQFQEYIQDIILDALSDVLGFDLQTFADIIRNPSAWLDEGTPVPLPPPLDVFNSTGLFADGEHERLDEIIGFDAPGLTDQHHRLSDRRLDADAQLIIDEFDPLANTITTAKLLLLDGDQLDQVLTDNLGRQMDTYPSGDRTNVMIDALGSDTPWLFSIDSDHAWRQDGLPRFCDAGSSSCATYGAQPRLSTEDNGGHGTMPIWESCVARPAFRTLFKDWENEEPFPDLGDGVSADPGSDPNAPTSSATLDPASAVYDNGAGRVFVGGDNSFTLSAVDTPAGKGFPPSQLELRYRVTGPNGYDTGWVDAAIGEAISLDGADGKYTIATQAGDPCHTLAGGDTLEPEAEHSADYWLDTTAPVCTCHTPPFGNTYDTDDLATVDYSVDDGPDGSGVASVSSIIDGYLTSQTATTAIADGDPIDMYLFYPGLRTVTVTAADNIGNTGDSPCTFTIVPTSASIANNLIRARAEGKVPYASVYKGLTDKITQAVAKHTRGQHPVERNALDAFAEQIEGHIGGGVSSGIEIVTGRRFIAYARYVIANSG